MEKRTRKSRPKAGIVKRQPQAKNDNWAAEAGVTFGEKGARRSSCNFCFTNDNFACFLDERTIS